MSKPARLDPPLDDLTEVPRTRLDPGPSSDSTAIHVENAASDAEDPAGAGSATGRAERRRNRRRAGLAALGMVLVAATVGAAVVIDDRLMDAEPLAEADIDRQIDNALSEVTVPPALSADAFQQIFPSVVFIQVDAPAAEPADDSDDGNTGEPGGSAGSVTVGSGVIINADGDILTSDHVVNGAESVKVVFSDGTESEAQIISSTPESDLALLRPAQGPAVLVPAVLAGLAGLSVGDEAYAIGSPLGLTGSFSAGVVSGFGRSIPLPDGGRLDDLIQFDTAVNPGNSGGPLLNRYGHVVGIVTALANPTDQAFFSGIGFAVPLPASGGGGGGAAPAQ